jgi:hypothetical protein
MNSILHPALVFTVALCLAACGDRSSADPSNTSGASDVLESDNGNAAHEDSAQGVPLDSDTEPEDDAAVILPTPDLCDLDVALVAEPSSVNLWWWQGEPAPSQMIELADVPQDCGFAIVVSHDWIEAEVMGSTVTITIDPSLTQPGLRLGEVRVMGAQAANATLIPVVARLWSEPTAGATPMALIIGIDGVRPDALEAAETPYMDLLIRGGASSFTAHTQLTAPTKSGPGWASILTGVDADKHLVESNDLADMDQKDPAWPSVVERAKSALGVGSTAIVNWIPVALLLPETAVESYQTGDDVQVGSMASESLRELDHGLTFVHLDEVDGYGHSTGFSKDNPLYIAAIEASDLYVGQMLTGILDRPTFPLEDWLIVVTTDHGGAGLGHGPMDADNQTIWLVAAGSGVPQQTLGSEVSHMDVHPTVMAHLGAWPEDDWDLDGQVVGVTP